MHRSIVQPGQIPLESDILTTNKHGMIASATLAQAILGTGTLVDGLAISPTTPTSLSLLVGPGSIYQQAVVDSTPYGSLAADTTHTIVKQGISLNTLTQTFVAPTTTGYAQNFLVQAQFQETDGDPVLRPYFNSSNPPVPLQGPGNNGQQDNTTRKGQIALSVKAGLAATAGSQVSPTPDAGYVGLYVVTLTNGQTAITSGNISTYPGAPFIPVKLPGVPTAVQLASWTYAQGTGSASALSASISPPPAALVAGMCVSVRSPFTNGGTTTFNLNNLGVKAVVARDGTALLSGDIANGSIVILQYNGAAWQLISDRSSPGSIPVIADNSLWHYGTSTAGTTSAFTTTLTPVPATATAGLCFRVPITATNTIGTSPATTTIDFGFGAKPIIVNRTGVNLVGGELPGGTGFDADFIYDGTSARLVNPAPLAINSNPQFFHAETVRAVGVTGPTMPANSTTYITWVLNTLFTNQIAGASLNTSTGEITLPAGTYRIFAWGMAYNAGQHNCRLYNSTTSTEIKAGSTADSYISGSSLSGSPATTNASQVQYRVTLTGSNIIVLQHVNGAGGPGLFGDQSTNHINYDACVRIERELNS